jgi:hypothetical protein
LVIISASEYVPLEAMTLGPNIFLTAQDLSMQLLCFLIVSHIVVETAEIVFDIVDVDMSFAVKSNGCFKNLLPVE